MTDSVYKCVLQYPINLQICLMQVSIQKHVLNPGLCFHAIQFMWCPVYLHAFIATKYQICLIN